MIIAHPQVCDRALEAMIDDFLTDLVQSNRSVHTRRAYAADLTCHFGSLFAAIFGSYLAPTRGLRHPSVKCLGGDRGP